MSVTITQFFEQLRESEVLPAAEVDALWKRIARDDRDKGAERLMPKLVENGRLTRYQATAILEGQGRMLVLGDYVLLDKIGAGGMGQVFKAQNRRMKRLVAIKLLPQALTEKPDAVKRFQREVEAAARLSHPNIVEAHDAGEQKGIHYLVMEYVAADDLAHIVRKHGALSVEQAVSYVAQAAKGLAYAHQQGVIHRDIKPANLLLDPGGTIKILDMGLARFEGSTVDELEDGLTNSGAMLGTIDYMSPEQALDAKNAGPQCDVYSLGCTLFFLLTGRRVYEGDTVMKRLLGHRESPIPALTDQRGDVPPTLRAIFSLMVAKRPADRYQSMFEVYEELESCRRAFASGTQRHASSPGEGRDFDLQLEGTGPAIGAKRVAARPPPRVECAEPANEFPALQTHEPEFAVDPLSRRIGIPAVDFSLLDSPPYMVSNASFETPRLYQTPSPAWPGWQRPRGHTTSGPPPLFWFACAGLVAVFMMVIPISLVVGFLMQGGEGLRNPTVSTRDSTANEEGTDQVPEVPPPALPMTVIAPPKLEESGPKLGEIIENSLQMKLAYIPPGEFEMGSPESEQDHQRNEK